MKKKERELLQKMGQSQSNDDQTKDEFQLDSKVDEHEQRSLQKVCLRFHIFFWVCYYLMELITGCCTDFSYLVNKLVIQINCIPLAMHSLLDLTLHFLCDYVSHVTNLGKKVYIHFPSNSHTGYKLLLFDLHFT